jgi:hypothetical protein
MFRAIVFTENEWKKVKTDLGTQLHQFVTNDYFVAHRHDSKEVQDFCAWIDERIIANFPDIDDSQPFAEHVLLSELAWGQLSVTLAFALAEESRDYFKIISRESGQEILESHKDFFLAQIFRSISTVAPITEKPRS